MTRLPRFDNFISVSNSPSHTGSAGDPSDDAPGNDGNGYGHKNYKVPQDGEIIHARALWLTQARSMIDVSRPNNTS